jgi:hypothetical protein
MNRLASLILRYVFIIILSLNSLYVFYMIFGPLTLYLSYFALSLFYNASIEHSAIVLNGSLINLIDACIAGAAYYLLFILNFSTPKIKKRFSVLFLEFLAFLILNVIRIVVLAALFMNDFAYFTEVHIISWNILSGLIVIVIWIASIKIFRIKEIPFYSDFIYLKKLTKKK